MSARRATRTQDLLQQMSGAVIPVDDAERAAARRERVVSRLEALHDEIDERRRRSQVRTRKVAMLAVAALPLLAVGGYALAKHSGTAPPAPVAQAAPAQLSVRSGPVLLARGSAPERPARGAERLASGDRVRTGHDGRAGVRMHSGTDIEMSPVTELTMGAEVAGWRSESVDLARGRVDVSVPALARGASFEVVTPDASISVRASRFTVIVEPGPDGAAGTRVIVRDGKARVVSHGSRTPLAAGAHWASSSAAAPKPPPAAPPAGKKAAASPPDVKAAAPAKTPAMKTAGATKLPDVSSASSLAEQNRLFQAAMDARRRGDDTRALALLNQLLGRYPGSPLEQDARVERFRALKRLGRSDDATRAARRYLAEHPQGFARDEARRLALDPGN